MQRTNSDKKRVYFSSLVSTIWEYSHKKLPQMSNFISHLHENQVESGIVVLVIAWV